MDSTQIDKTVTFDIQYEYHPAIKAISDALSGGDLVPEEPAHIEISLVSIEGSQLMYKKELWAELAEQILEDYRED